MPLWRQAKTWKPWRGAACAILVRGSPAGVPVVLEFSARDFVHGFSLPDLKLRADLPPGTVTRLRFTPEQPGVHEFLCDNFCGEGHERMQGRMIVEGGG